MHLKLCRLLEFVELAVRDLLNFADLELLHVSNLGHLFDVRRVDRDDVALVVISVYCVGRDRKFFAADASYRDGGRFLFLRSLVF